MGEAAGEKEEAYYILMALGKADPNRREGVYDYEALLAAVPETICLRRVEDPDQSTYGFLFARISAGRAERLEELLTMDLDASSGAKNCLDNDAQFFNAVLETLPADAQGFCRSGNVETVVLQYLPEHLLFILIHDLLEIGVKDVFP